MLAVVDVASVAMAMLFAPVLRFGVTAGLDYATDRTTALLVLCAAFPPVFYVCGLYDTRRLRNPIAALFPAAFAVATGALLGGAWLYAAGSPAVGRGLVVIFSFLLFAALILSRMLFVRAARSGLLSVRCLVIGSAKQVERVVRLVRHHPESGLTLVGMLQPSHEAGAAHASPENGPAGCPSLGTLDTLDAVVAREKIGRVIVATSLAEEPLLQRCLRPVRYRGVELIDFVSLYEELAREIPLDEIDDEWLLWASTMSSPIHIRRLKRAMDLAISLALLPPALVVLGFAAVAIKLTSRGPILFRQERVGLGSRPFMVLKLRTMREDAEKLTGPVWSTENDPRITPAGRVLRKYRIDELPQLFNVLRGDMSLIGPRPERPLFVDKLAEAAPFYSERLLVRPGVTGWAQVMAPYAATVGDSIRKLQFDLYYVKNLSLPLDLLILVKTARTVLFGRERVQGGMTAGQLLETMVEPTTLSRAATPLSSNAFAGIEPARPMSVLSKSA